MGAPIPDMQPADDVAAEVLLDSFKHIAAAERRRHASVFNYWLTIRGKRAHAPIRDLDPLEISDAGPSSMLLEMVGGGEDAEIRHLGQAIKCGISVDKISEAPNPSLLACIAGKLPIVAATKQAFAFEDEFEGEQGATRCWVTLLPFSSTGNWVEFVYGFVSLDPAPDAVADVADEEPVAIEEAPEPEVFPMEEPEAAGEPEVEPEPEPEPGPEPEPAEEPEAALDPVLADEPEAFEESVATFDPVDEFAPPERADHEDEPAPPVSSGRPGFSKLFDALAGVGGFYGTNVKVEPSLPPIPEAAPEDIHEEAFEAAHEEVREDVPEEVQEVHEQAPEEIHDSHEEVPDDIQEAREEIHEETQQPVHCEAEGVLESKLADVRAKADEARMAKIRSNLALYEGLGAAYDFALDAEEHAEEYLKLVEAQGLKIQLRSPMKPVVKLAFEGMCDDATIAQLEAVLAWALKSDLPRGSLAKHLEEEGGIGAVLNNGSARAAA